MSGAQARANGSRQRANNRRRVFAELRDGGPGKRAAEIAHATRLSERTVVEYLRGLEAGDQVRFEPDAGEEAWWRKRGRWWSK